MIVDSSVEISASAPMVWDVFVDVDRWSEWTASIQRIEPLDGPAIEVGKRFKIKQPGLPNLVWTVSAVDPGVSWTWSQRSPGGMTIAAHEVVPQGAGRTLATQRIEQRGPIGTLVGMLMQRRTKAFLDLEAKGLKARSEERRDQDASST
jgi:ligand-binding SRPBCC domain-containing protein